MNKSLLLLSGCILFGCSSKKISPLNNVYQADKIESLTLEGDSNISTPPSFQKIIQIEGLESLVHNGFQKNNSWKVQLAKVNVVRTELGLTISGSKPSIEGTISWSEGREKTRESGFIEKTIPSWKGGASFNWEIDVWGKWKLLKESAKMHLIEAEYIKESSRIVFVNEIANAWILLAAQKEELDILKKSINSHQKSINFYEKKVQVGEENNATLSRQKVAFDQLLLEEASLLRRYEITKLRLHYLTSNKLNSDIPKIAKLSEIKLPILPKVFPTNALKSRPDLKAKEAKIRENLYLEKSMKYDLYPSLSFQTSGFILSSNLSEPFEQWKASIGPVLNLPIWNPRKKSELSVVSAQNEVFKEEWRASINLAIEEIESATRSFLMSKNELSIALRSSQQSSSILAVTKAKLEAGLVSQLELLEDERQFLDSNRKSIKSRLRVFQFALDLTKSLGIQWA
ncbi:MAG: hypothetical protein CMI23_01990 [Opitutae bacterium]|nr:hypothetical protein [Opitutae bacterium]